MAATNGTSSKSLSPSALCHVVLRTPASNYQAMIDFYVTFLGAKISHGSPVITFLTYDYEHHRIAILNLPNVVPQTESVPPGSLPAGLAHVAFGFDNLSDLATSYEQKKAAGILPTWSVNHGVTTSMYYTDPDGNDIETQVDNFATAEEATVYMNSPAFQENPVGVDFDPEELVKRIRSGKEDDKTIKARPNIGPRFTR